MAADPNPNRRTVLAGAVLASVAAGPAAFAATAAAAPTLTLFDPDDPTSCAFAATSRVRGGQVAAIEGDRIRLARRLFTEQRPRSIAAVTRYADLLLLAGSAEDEGYRRIRVVRLKSSDGVGPLFQWSVTRA